MPRDGFGERLEPGEGPLGGALMLVGEQPGDQEDREGRPFVGPAGRLLDTCLEEAGIDRKAVFVTNAVKRFKFAPRGKRRLHQTPTAGDIAHYRWWLAEEVRIVDPKAIVALGGTAMQAFTGNRTLGARRGVALDWEGHRLIGTIHPSYLLRLRDEEDRRRERARFVDELKTARQLAAGGR